MATSKAFGNVAKLRSMVDVTDPAFGAIGNGSTNNTSALNAAIAWLNAANFRGLYIPAGNFVIAGALSAIVQSGVAVEGPGKDVARITVSAAASPSNLGTVFTVGDDAVSAVGRIQISGLGIVYLNTPSASANPFVVKNAADVAIKDIWLNGAAGIITIGSTAQTANRVNVSGIFGNYNGSANVGGFKVIEIIRAISCYFNHILVACLTGSGTGYAVHIAPPSGDFIDEMRFGDVTIFANGQSHGVYLDFTNEKIVNLWFRDCVFDGNEVASFALVSTSGAKECRNINVESTRLDTNPSGGGNCVLVSHAGTGVVTGIDFHNCLLSYRANKAVVATGTIRDISFRGCRVQDSSATLKSAAMSFGTGGFAVIGCRFFKYDATGNTTSAVETTADVDNYTVTDNIAPQLAGAFMTHSSYAAYSAARIVRDNVGAIDPQAIILASSGVQVVAPNDTNENVLATVTVPANVMGKDGRIEVITMWNMTSSVNTKTPRVRFSGAAGTLYTSPGLTTVASAKYHTAIHNRGATNSQSGGMTGGTGGWGTPAVSVATSAVDTSVATTISINSLKDAGAVAVADALSLESYLVVLYPR